ncbi:uncharacterized protein UBRO_20205 [Ustilago bromivora]|uniref:DDE Tnp4 domain-containing protein n=1 Tax=Ustilago bromivora TaxID=307758 RepID=A0A1K0G7U0_9BASI|nr:uncharacterized protein UBRO_20205 [Ustilago bromivora]
MVCFSSKQDQLNSIIQTLEVSLPTELDHYAEELQDPHFDVDDYDSSPGTDDGPTPLSAGLICILLKLNKEVMQFALEVERQSASAWVQRTTRVEEWGKGWLVVDSTHVPLAWKPGMMSQEPFGYKGFYSMNVALVILPHSHHIVESVVGQPGSVQDSKVWTSGSNVLKKP